MSGTDRSCPCCSGQSYTACCQPRHTGQAPAETAEQLMRSRYSAYTLRLIDYLVETTHPEKRPPSLQQAVSDWADQVEFYRLDIIATQQGQATDKVGKVEFVAHYRYQSTEQRLHETSRFKRYRKHWTYLDGEIRG